jgi:hypothetical protein
MDCASPVWAGLIPSLKPETGGSVASEPLGAGACADTGRMQTNKPATPNMSRYIFIVFAQIGLNLIINPSRARWFQDKLEVAFRLYFCRTTLDDFQIRP